MNAEALLPVLLELLAKSALIALAATLLLRAWRGVSAAQRHLVWFVALATVMLLPLTRLVAPFWKIPLIAAKKAPVVTTVRLPARVAPMEAEWLDAEPAVAVSVHQPFDWRLAVLGVWCGGAALLLGHRLFGSWRLHRLLRRSVAVDDPRLRLLLSRTLSELGLHRRPEIRLSEECRVPITWGSLRPVMLLPKAALGWSDNWVLAALRHEGAHICRYDYLTRWFAHVACALYWPNPLVWLLTRSLRVAQELAADDLVLRAGTPPEEYASQLVDAARTVTTHGFFVRQAVAMACPSTLEDRVRAIIDGRRDRRPLSRWAAACGSLTVALVLGVSTAAQLRSDEEKAGEQKPAPGFKPASESKPASEAAAAAVGPQIEIETKFIEMTSRPETDKQSPADDWFRQVIPGVMEHSAGKFAVFSDPQFQVIIRALNQKKGVDLLASPRITTRPGQPAKVEVIREFRYASEWEKVNTKWTPAKSEIKNVGVTLDVDPRIAADGSIELHETATVVEFKGFVDLDGAATPPAKKKKGIEVITSEYPPVPKGHRSKPIFSERKSEQTVKLKSEETVVIGDLPAERDRQNVNGREVFSERKCIIFISTRIITSAPIGDGKVIPDGPITKEWKLPFDLIPAKADNSGSIPAKEWLTSKGVKFEGEASAVFTLGASRLIVRNTQAQIDLIDQIVATAVEEQGKSEKASGNLGIVTDEVFVRRRYLDFLGRVPTPDEARAFLADPKPSGEKRQALVERLTEQLKTGAPAPAAQESAARQKAEKIIIPVLEFKEATLSEALDFLRKQAVESDPEKTGVKITVKPGTITGMAADARITVSLRTIPVIEALRYVTGLANVEFVVTPDALVVQPVAAGGGGAGAGPEKIKDMQAEVEELKAALAKSQERLKMLQETAGETPRGKPAKPRGDRASNDPGDLFVDAYMIMQEAEKFEAAGDFESALESMRRAAQGFEQISAAYPNWQPQIMAYRKSRVAAAVERLKGRVIRL